MRLKNKMIISFIFGIICISFFRINSVQAMSQEEAGKYISEFSINFFNNYADQTIYSYNDNQRGAAYKGMKTSGITASYSPTRYTDKYAMDCVGWVNFVIHQSLGLGSNSSMTFFGQPHGYGQIGAFFNGFTAIEGNPNSWEQISNSRLYQIIRPGDLLLATCQHILIYVGNGEVIHCTGGGPGISYGGNKGYGIVRNSLDELGYGIACIGRITESTAASINPSAVTTIFNGKGGLTYFWEGVGDLSDGATTSTGTGWIVDPDDKLELFKHILFTEKYNFNRITWERYGHDTGNFGISPGDNPSSTSNTVGTNSSSTQVSSNGLNTPSNPPDNTSAEKNETEGYRGTFTDSKNRTYKEYKQGYEPWKNVAYWGSNIWGKGCGPTALAIIASGYGINQTPETVANYMVGNTGAEKLSDALTNCLHLTNTVSYSNYSNKIKECLSAGRPVVVSVGHSPTNMFTNSSHILAVLSINEQNEVWVSNANSGKTNGWVSLDTLVSHVNYIITIDSDK